MSTRYAAVHKPSNGPGDPILKPTAVQLVEDDGLTSKLSPVKSLTLVTGVSSGIGVGIETAKALKATGLHVFDVVCASSTRAAGI